MSAGVENHSDSGSDNGGGDIPCMQRLVSSDGSSSEDSEDEELHQPSQSGQSAQTATIKRSFREGLPELGAG
eukprot:601448-Pleurochrysis_carterae.AAC.1